MIHLSRRLELRLGRSKRIQGQGIHEHADRRVKGTARQRVSGKGEVSVAASVFRSLTTVLPRTEAMAGVPVR